MTAQQLQETDIETVFSNAQQLQERFGARLQQAPLNIHPSAGLLHKALKAQSISVSLTTVKTWWDKYRNMAVKSDDVSPGMRNAEEIEQLYGERCYGIIIESRSVQIQTLFLRWSILYNLFSHGGSWSRM